MKHLLFSTVVLVCGALIVGCGDDAPAPVKEEIPQAPVKEEVTLENFDWNDEAYLALKRETIKVVSLAQVQVSNCCAEAKGRYDAIAAQFKPEQKAELAAALKADQVYQAAQGAIAEAKDALKQARVVAVKASQKPVLDHFKKLTAAGQKAQDEIKALLDQSYAVIKEQDEAFRKRLEAKQAPATPAKQ